MLAAQPSAALATSVRPVGRDQTELDPTESHTGRGWFLLSPGATADEGAHGTGPIPTKTQFPCRTQWACLP